MERYCQSNWVFHSPATRFPNCLSTPLTMHFSSNDLAIYLYFRTKLRKQTCSCTTINGLERYGFLAWHMTFPECCRAGIHRTNSCILVPFFKILNLLNMVRKWVNGWMDDFDWLSEDFKTVQKLDLVDFTAQMKTLI